MIRNGRGYSFEANMTTVALKIPCLPGNAAVLDPCGFGVDIPQITKGEPDASDNLFSTLESA